MQQSIDPAAQFMLAVAEKEHLETAWDRFEKQQRAPLQCWLNDSPQPIARDTSSVCEGVKLNPVDTARWEMSDGEWVTLRAHLPGRGAEL